MIEVEPAKFGGGCRCCPAEADVMAVEFTDGATPNHALVVNLCTACRRQLLHKLIGDTRELFLRWRHIDLGDECVRCQGNGWKLYASTATWRGGMGGAMMTCDVCDACWGSGDRWRPGCDLRRLRDEEAARVAEAAVDALAQSCGATMSTTRPQILALVQLLRDEVAKVDGPRRRPTGGKDSVWYAPLVKGLADLLERAVRGSR